MLEWPIIAVLVNILAVMGLSAALIALSVISLYLARFLRPKNVKKLFDAEIPSFKEITGTLKFFGQEIAANAKLDTQRDVQLDALERRTSSLEGSLELQEEVLRRLVNELRLLAPGDKDDD